MKPQVSVIIPAYNGASYICESIESVLSQTYKQFEIIVIDDGSADNTREVLEPYIMNSSIRYFYQDNAGHGAARNTGIRYAQGKYVCFLDQDDWFEKDSLERRLNLYEKYPELGFVSSYFRAAFMSDNCSEIVYTEGHVKKDNLVERFPSRFIEIKDKDFYIFNKTIFPELILSCFAWIGTVMFRKEVFDDVGLFPENLRWSPDHDLLIRIAMQYNIGFLNTSTAIYRQHARNMSLEKDGYYNETAKHRIKYLDPCYGLQNKDKKRLRASIGNFYFLNGRWLIGTAQHSRAAKIILSGIKYNPFCFKHYIFLLFAIMPPKIASILKKLKEKYLTCNNSNLRQHEG